MKLQIGAVVLLSYFIYVRLAIIKTFYYNTPGRFQTIRDEAYTFKQVQPQVRNCEDIILHDGKAILSCDPGRDTWNTVMGTFINASSPDAGLYLYDYTADSLERIEVDFEFQEFHPLGIEYEPETKRLYVANHAFSGSRIEIFQLEGHIATHLKTIKHDLLATPNSILAISPTELLITNDHHFRRRYTSLAIAETFLSIPGGTVTYVKLNDLEVEVSIVARVPFANGIARIDSTIAVASSTTASIQFFDLQGASLKYRSSLALPFIPDNLSVDNGMLLIAGHPHSPSLTKVAKNARFYADPAYDRSPYLSWVAEWSAETGLRTIYADRDFGTSTTFVRDSDTGIGLVTGLYERGLLRMDSKI